MKYLHELLTRIQAGESASTILSGLDPRTKGHTGEGILRLLTLLGIHPTDHTRSVIPYHVLPTSRRLEKIVDRQNLIDTGRIDSGGSNKIDVCWRDGPQISVCSSKIGMIQIKSIADLEIPVMLTEFTEAGGYTENGVPVSRAEVIPFVLIENKAELLKVAERSKASNYVSKVNLNPLDIYDLDRMCSVFRQRLAANPDILTNTKAALRLRFHQIMITLKVNRLIAAGKKTILIGALPRSGKTYMGAAIAKQFNRILIITTRPGETRSQWNAVFKNHREFTGHVITDMNAVFSSHEEERLVAVASIQFFKKEERNTLIGLHWDLVILDEIHEGGSTDLSDEVLDTYIGPVPIRLMMTATYKKTADYYNIPLECCCFWDLEDVRLMRSWPESRSRLSEKYSADLPICDTDAAIRESYIRAPSLGILTNIMQQDVYERFRTITDAPENRYGFSMRALFALNKAGNAFQNQEKVDDFLASITGSDYMTRYGKHGNMSMFARIRRYWKTAGHRNNDEFMTQMWFLPYGQGQCIADLKAVIMARINANPVLRSYAVHTLDSGLKVDGIGVGDFSKAVADAVTDAKAAGKKGLILLTGNVGSLGVSLPEVDVAFMLHDVESADMTYQQMMRVLTEQEGKRFGLVVDFNVWRVLSTLNTYAASRCGQGGSSSVDRISWCVSHLIDVDPDLWTCPESPEGFTQNQIIDDLVAQWRSMLQQTSTTLTVLSRKPVDIGEDQRDLDSIAKYMKPIVAKVTLEINPDQERLPSGIEVRDEEDSNSVDSAEKTIKKANLNDVLARLILEIALLSDFATDLKTAFQLVYANETYRRSLNEFLNQLYGVNSENPFGVLVRLLQRNYENLKDARETFEVISSRMSIIDDLEELYAVLVEHLKPKQIEKKLNGEVFTPPTLIAQKLDKLTQIDPHIWSDPSKRFLDPANGIGNYPALVYHRLMVGLKEAIPDESARRQHILENMIYMCELNGKNIDVSRKILDRENAYDLKLHHGSFLEMDTMAIWGIAKFDVILGNPPYNAPGTGASGNTIWETFLRKSLTLLAPNGYIVFVHPCGWRKPNTERGRFNGLFKNLTQDNQLLYLNINNANKGMSVFQCGTRFDWYIMKACSPYTVTEITDENDSTINLDLSTYKWLPNADIDIVNRILHNGREEACEIIQSMSAYEPRKLWMSVSQSDVFKYPCVHATNKSGVRYMYSKVNDRGHFGIPKVIFGDSGITNPIIDMEGAFGMTQHAMAIRVSSREEAEMVVKALTSKRFQRFLGSCMWSTFAIEWNMFSYFKRTFYTEFPFEEASATMIDYTKMTVAALRDLCTERKITGITGKKKAELIALLEAPPTIRRKKPVVPAA